MPRRGSGSDVGHVLETEDRSPWEDVRLRSSRATTLGVVWFGSGGSPEDREDSTGHSRCGDPGQRIRRPASWSTGAGVPRPRHLLPESPPPSWGGWVSRTRKEISKFYRGPLVVRAASLAHHTTEDPDW